MEKRPTITSAAALIVLASGRRPTAAWAMFAIGATVAAWPMAGGFCSATRNFRFYE
jgi:hypothetical protein